MPHNFYVFDRLSDVSRAARIAAHPALAPGMDAHVLAFAKTIELPDGSAPLWLHEHLADAECLVVLIGASTVNDRWVREAIAVARSYEMPIIGVTIDRVADEDGEQGATPRDPFVTLGLSPRALSQIEVYVPPFVLSAFARSHIAYSLPDWVALAVRENARRVGSRGGRIASIARNRRIDLEAQAS
ncbi:TIR domain-containing protein [Agreia sp. COWG]|uniref:TIR domain-containing protein n=1 Tax=Agreia sp. COWG TaxID=2773266 RepID=UPI001927DADC|nr:TIR domain-containing protein [Agreia sp. COWG]CAD5998692.1 conserved protein of unknown function [Agreia sp. COWG]